MSAPKDNIFSLTGSIRKTNVVSFYLERGSYLSYVGFKRNNAIKVFLYLGVFSLVSFSNRFSLNLVLNQFFSLSTPYVFSSSPKIFFLNFIKPIINSKTDRGKDEKRFDPNPFFFVIPPFNFQVGLMG